MFSWLKSLLFGKKEVMEEEVLAGCGHYTKLKGIIKVIGFDKEIQTEWPHKDAQPPYCIKCRESMTILCALCRMPIFPNDPITLHTLRDLSWELPAGAQWHDKIERIAVGCLRWGCADTGADRLGFWVAPGKVRRVLSPIEQCVMTGLVVEISDLRDQKQAIVPEQN